MVQEYIIKGMTCGNCQSSVEKSLLTITGVKEVEIDLKTGRTKVISDIETSVSDLKKALPEKYSVETKMEVEKPKSDLKKLFPLFLILTYVTVASFFLQKPWSTEGFMLDFMGLFLLVFSFFKYLDLRGFVNSFRMYDPLAKKLEPYAWAYPFTETILGLMFLFRVEINIAIIISIVVLMITTIGVLRILLDKRSIQCACLGTALKLPMTKATIIENVIMLSMAFWMILKTI